MDRSKHHLHGGIRLRFDHEPEHRCRMRIIAGTWSVSHKFGIACTIVRRPLMHAFYAIGLVGNWIHVIEGRKGAARQSLAKLYRPLALSHDHLGGMFLNSDAQRWVIAASFFFLISSNLTRQPNSPTWALVTWTIPTPNTQESLPSSLTPVTVSLRCSTDKVEINRLLKKV